MGLESMTSQKFSDTVKLGTPLERWERLPKLSSELLSDLKEIKEHEEILEERLKNIEEFKDKRFERKLFYVYAGLVGSSASGGATGVFLSAGNYLGAALSGGFFVASVISTFVNIYKSTNVPKQTKSESIIYTAELAEYRNKHVTYLGAMQKINDELVKLYKYHTECNDGDNQRLSVRKKTVALLGEKNELREAKIEPTEADRMSAVADSLVLEFARTERYDNCSCYNMIFKERRGKEKPYVLDTTSVSLN